MNIFANQLYIGKSEFYRVLLCLFLILAKKKKNKKKKKKLRKPVIQMLHLGAGIWCGEGAGDSVL